MAETLITLPDREAMQANLDATCDDPFVRTHFFSLLLQHAGKHGDLKAIVQLVVLSLEQYAPLRGTRKTIEVDALEVFRAFIGNEVIAQQALDFMVESMKKSDTR